MAAAPAGACAHAEPGTARYVVVALVAAAVVYAVVEGSAGSAAVPRRAHRA